MNNKFLKYTVIIIFIIVSYYLYNKISFNEKDNYPKIQSINKTISKLNKTKDPVNQILEFDKDDFHILIVADSHLNAASFEEIKKIILKYPINLLIHLGDHTNFGSAQELKLSKELIEDLSITYIAIPGDRDLAATGDDNLFFSIYKKLLVYDGKFFKLMFINNSPNFTPLTDEYLFKVKNEIPNSKFIFTSQPIFVEKGNILESKYMGSPTAFSYNSQQQKVNQEKYLKQRNEILKIIQEKGNKLIVSGDHHRSAFFNDPLDNSVSFHIVGATAEYLNSDGFSIKQKSFQSQRVSILSIKKDSSYKLKEIVLFEE